MKQLFTILATLYTIAGLADQPNVILIITDDQGYGDVSAHGSPVLKTPHVDKLRSQAVSFTDFHVAPIAPHPVATLRVRRS